MLPEDDQWDQLQFFAGLACADWKGMANEMIKAAVLGFGTVGSGVVELLDINKSSVGRRVPGGVEVKYILDLRDFPDSPYRDRVIHDFDRIVEDPEIKESKIGRASCRERV